MYRYHLIASFDKDLHSLVCDTYPNTSTISVRLPFLASNSSFRYGLQTTMNELSKQSIYPSESGIDAIILGLMVYIADMKISRDKQSQNSWTREITLTIPVFDGLWKEYKVTLERMLKFLTGDIWEIQFTKREVFLADKEKFGQRTDKYRIASLFSGGMDSLIAAINYMEQKQPTLLVSHAGEGRVRHWQINLLAALDSEYSNVSHENAYLWTNLADIELPEAEKDMNQRSRSFLFIAIAILAMSGTKGCTQLLMPENGLIALNVPLEYMRIGSHSTRTTHPFYLKLWNEVVGGIFKFSISNPYWNKTKGEMAAECLNKDFFKKVVNLSYSCSSVNSANIRSGQSQHCGHCLPCIIRRAAMHGAFGDFDPSSYLYPKVKELIDDRGAIGEQIRSFQYAIKRLRENPCANKILIHKPGPLENDETYLTELVDVYTRGLMEVEQWIQDSLEMENVN